MLPTSPPIAASSSIDELPPHDCHPKIRRLFEHWKSIHPPGGLLPGRQHLDPLHVPKLLPVMWMLDVYRDPLRFRYRLIGTDHVFAMETDPTGKWFDDVHPALMTGPLYTLILAATERGLPAYRRGKPTIQLEKDYLELETMMLPLATDGRTVDILLGITVYGRTDLD